MKIGFTTSIPIEIIFGADKIPIDLNNLFISDNPSSYVEKAEIEGFPTNICSWIKGIYSTVVAKKIDTVVGVVQGDCSNTHSLMSILEEKKINVISFSYPFDRNKDYLASEIDKLECYFNTNRKKTLEFKKRLDLIRVKLKEVDELTYKDHKVTGFENHQWLVSASDFRGNPDLYEKELDEFLFEARQREPIDLKLRTAFLGVPPIYDDFYDFTASNGVGVIFNEIQRQFSMTSLKKDLIEQYMEFTYPYDIFGRIKDILMQSKIRKVDCFVSYSQAFCHRQIDNILLKKYLKKPFIIIEGDRPGLLDERTKLRLESFFEINQ